MSQILMSRSTALGRCVIVLTAWLVIFSGAGLVLAQEDGAEPVAPAAAAAADEEPAAKEPAEPVDDPAVDPAEDAAADLGDGRLIRVRLPLIGNADAHIISSIQRAVAQLKRSQRPDQSRPACPDVESPPVRPARRRPRRRSRRSGIRASPERPRSGRSHW